MLALTEILVLAWLLFTLFGLFALSWVPRQVRDMLFPALPAVGALFLVVALHDTGLVLPVGWGLALIAVVALAAVVLRRRVRARFAVSRAALMRLLVATLMGLVPLGVAMLPMVRVGKPEAVMPGTNHDTLAFVSLTSWLDHHPITEKPDARRDLPGYGYVRNHDKYSLRVGEELLQGSVATVTRRPPTETFNTVLAFWLFLLPGVTMAAAELLGVRRVAGLLAGALIGLSALTVGQVYLQNAGSVLGIALIPVVLALIAAAFKPPGSTAADDEPRQRVPVWVGAVALAGIVGTYSEYLPMLVPAFGLYVFARRPAAIVSHLRRAVLVAGIALAVAPLAWIRAAGSLSQQNTKSQAGQVSTFLDVGPMSWIARVTGMIRTLELTNGRRWVTLGALTLFGLIVVGIALSIALGPVRRLWLFVPASVVGVVFYLSRIDREPYSQERSIQIGAPLLILAAVVGYDALARRLPVGAGLSLRSLGGAGVAVACAFGVALFGTVNTRTATRDEYLHDPLLAARTVDHNFDEAATWIRDVGGPGGRDAVVLSRDFVDQLWIVYGLRDLNRVQYPFLYPDYYGTPVAQVWNGRTPRYALVDPDVYVDVAPGVVIRHNDRFRLLDLSRGPALLAITADGWQGPIQIGNILQTFMQANGTLAVLWHGDITATRVSAKTIAALAPLPVTIDVDGRPAASATLTSEPATVLLALPAGRSSAQVIMRNGKPPVLEAGIPTSLLLEGVRRG